MSCDTLIRGSLEIGESLFHLLNIDSSWSQVPLRLFLLWTDFATMFLTSGSFIKKKELTTHDIVIEFCFLPNRGCPHRSVWINTTVIKMHASHMRFPLIPFITLQIFLSSPLYAIKFETFLYLGTVLDRSQYRQNSSPLGLYFTCWFFNLCSSVPSWFHF